MLKLPVYSYLEGMSKNHDELDHLEVGEVLLPPDVATVLWSHGRQHIVYVHHYVHKCVDEAKECTVST